MRPPALTVAALLLLAGCGGSSTSSQLSVATPFADTPSATPTVTPPPATAAPHPTATEPAPGVITATAGTATAAPARTSSPEPAPPPRPTPTPVAGTVTVTDQDSNTTVHLAVGQHLRVRLSNGTWDPPESADQAVATRQSSAGGYPSDQPVDATFDAVGPGSTDVTTQSDAACFHTTPRCMMATRQWQIHVVVR